MYDRIEQVVSLIHADVSRNRRLEKLARVVNLSTSRLSHLSKQETGVSMLCFVHTVRFEQPKQLLEKAFLSMKEIRTRISFNEESHFIRTFEKAHHTAPSRYRMHLLVTCSQPNWTDLSSQQGRPTNSKISQN